MTSRDLDAGLGSQKISCPVKVKSKDESARGKMKVCGEICDWLAFLDTGQVGPPTSREP